MKTVTINFAAQTNVVSDYDLGRIGEHNATELVITPPTSLSGDERTAMYRIAFYTGSETILTESFTDTPIVIDLWQQLTQHARLSLQVVAYDTDGEFIGKSPKLAGFYFAPSVETSDVADISDAPDVTAEIGANTAARHTHDNKAILDAITNPPHSEITTVGQPYRSQYTPAELGQFYADRVVLTYGGLPVSSGNYDVMADTFTFSYQYVNHSDKTEIVCPTCTVASNKNITILNTYTVPKTINGKSAGGTTGAVTLNAGDITAASGWSPSADEDLATKKYVDENSGGQTYEIVASEYTPDTSPYTGAELWALWQAGERITYNHIPISFGYFSSDTFVFSTFEYDINGNPGYRALNTVNASRQIAVKTFKQFVKQINGATVSTAGYVTIKADNIQASANWTPSDDKDIATKKYVDDSIPTIPVSDVEDSNGNSLVVGTVATIPAIPDISGCEVTSNKVTAIDNTSTDTQYPSAKCVYDLIGDVEQILADLIGGA